MITREELIRSKEYWLAQLQTTLYQKVEEYLKENRMTKSEFAQKMGVSKGYISQILNGDFDHKLSKFIELSLMIDKVPLLKLEDIDKVLLLDKEKKLNEPDTSATDFTKNY
jgi:transcriptional regulator with XRE-family HTH domain